MKASFRKQLAKLILLAVIVVGAMVAGRTPSSAGDDAAPTGPCMSCGTVHCSWDIR